MLETAGVETKASFFTGISLIMGALISGFEAGVDLTTALAGTFFFAILGTGFDFALALDRDFVDFRGEDLACLGTVFFFFALMASFVFLGGFSQRGANIHVP